MDVPASKKQSRPSSSQSPSVEPSTSFLATVRHRLGGSSFALPSLLDDTPEHEHDSHHTNSHNRPTDTTHDDQDGDGHDEDEEDLEELMWDAQKALISHNTSLAISLYAKALLLPTQPSPAAALALGNLLSRGPDDRHLQIGAKTRVKKRREWETMNKAGGAYLVGLAVELDRAGLWGSGNLDLVSPTSSNGKGKGKARADLEKSPDPDDKQAENARRAAALQNAHEIAIHLLSLFRRGLVHPSDPTVPLPVRKPYHPLLRPPAPSPSDVSPESTPDANVWQLGQYLAGEVLALEWKLEEDVPESAGSEKTVALRTSLKMHLHYLLALTSHAGFPQESLDNFLALLELGPSDVKEASELLTSAQERVTSLRKRIASLSRAASQPSSPVASSTLSPSSAKANGRSPRRAPATPFLLSPQTTPSSEAPLPSFPFPRQPPAPRPLTATSPAVSTTQTFSFPAIVSSSNLPSDGNGNGHAPSSSATSAFRSSGYSRSPSLMSLQPQPTPPFRQTTRKTSIMSNRSNVSLSPSMLSMRLQTTRSEVVEGTIDESVVAEGAVTKVLPSKAGWGLGGSWFGIGSRSRSKKHGAEGSLRRLAVSSTLRAELREEVDVEAGPGNGHHRNGNANGNGKGKGRARIQSMFDPPHTDFLDESETEPLVPSSSRNPTTASSSSTPAASTSSLSPLPILSKLKAPPNLTLTTPTPPTSTLSPPRPPSARPFKSQPSSPRRPDNPPLRSPPSNPHLSRFGDQTLDPQLRQLEMDSIITQGSSCSVCNREGVNLPACPKCGVRFCSRECRVGELGAGDGKRHVCGLLEKRKVSHQRSGSVSRKRRESVVAAAGATTNGAGEAAKEIVV